MTRLPQGRPAALVTIALLLPLLAGCGGILSSPPQRQLYRLSPQFHAAAGLPHVQAQLLVATPTASAGLDTVRIAVSRSPVSLDYLADAEWTDRVPYLVQEALVEGFEKSAAIPAVGSDSGDLRADFEIDTAIRDFEAVYQAPNAPPQIVVRLDVRLVRMPERSILARTTVRHEARAAANTTPDIVRAFDAALGEAAEDAVRWTLGNPVLSERRRSGISRTRFVHAGGGAGTGESARARE
ncbi:MAG TPA: ABC-type transport auxiliary lipoprotein family protein [Stellaceae bacterium]|nr:ABC-type transport auxiliary lipoprotein family protein [Stellaceae bacterium]